MATIVTRAGKGSPLTFNEVDDNFTNLNTDGNSNAAAIAGLTSSISDKLTKTGDTMTGSLRIGTKLAYTSLTNTQTGTNVTLNPVSAAYISLTGAGLTSIAGLKSDTVLPGEFVIVQNLTGSPVEIKNRSTSALGGDRIYTYASGRTGVSTIYTSAYLADGDTAIFIYDSAGLWTMLPMPSGTVLSNGFKTSPQTISASTLTPVSFGTLQSNTNVCWNAVTSTYTVINPGFYQLQCMIDFQTNITGTYRQLSIYVDPGSGYAELTRNIKPVKTTIGNPLSVSTINYFATGDKIQFQAQHDATTSLTIASTAAAAALNQFSIMRIK